MTFKRLAGIGLIAAGILFIFIFLSQPKAVEAQCGSQSSSCRNCHEVSQTHPVNTSGEWHISHAFGDFCQFCHGGNVQATDANLAHTGMFYPLENPAGSCASCHPRDFQELAMGYGDILGVDVGSSAAIGANTDASALESVNATLAAPPPLTGENITLIDYNRRYAITVLGEKDPPAWGDPILAGLAIFLTGMVGFLFWRFEKIGDKLRELSQSPFLIGDPDHQPQPPDHIPGID